MADAPTLADRLDSTGRRIRNTARYLLGLDEPELGQSPRHLIAERDRVHLWRYDNDEATVKPPLLLVMSLVTRPTVFDLQPGNSLIEHFNAAGFDVFMLDWGNPGPADSTNTLETYCDDYLPWAVAQTTRAAGTETVTMFGYCFGGLIAFISAAGNPDMPIENLVVLATPVAPERGPEQLRPGRLGGTLDETGNVPAEAVRTAFVTIDPLADTVTGRLDLWQRMDDDQYVTAHRVMTGWGNDHIRFPGATAKQMERFFGDGRNALLAGEMRLGGRIIDPANITVPFLSVVGEKDHIAPIATSEPMLDLVGSDDKEELRVPAGHVGLFVGRSAAKLCIPGMVDWITRHSRES